MKIHPAYEPGLIIAVGKILDRDYKYTAKKNGFPVDRKKGDDLTELPIEKARFRSTFIPLAVVCCALPAYGWCLHFKVHFAVNLVLQLLLDMSLQVCFMTQNTLLMDLDPDLSLLVSSWRPGNLGSRARSHWSWRDLFGSRSRHRIVLCYISGGEIARAGLAQTKERERERA